jgi:hypothetical protein
MFSKWRHEYHLNVQKRVFDRLGRQNYIKLSRPGTNPRGIEVTKEALSNLVWRQRVKEHLNKLAKDKNRV